MSNGDPLGRIRWLWSRLHGFPGGRWLFSRLLGMFNPYSGSIRADIIELSSGHAKLRLKQRRHILNHLNSIHALALANLGELTSGLALIYGFTPEIRGIPVAISIEFVKKARGLLTAESDSSLPEVKEEMDYQVRCEIRDSENDLVAVTTVTWHLGLKENNA